MSLADQLILPPGAFWEYTFSDPTTDANWNTTVGTWKRGATPFGTSPGIMPAFEANTRWPADGPDGDDLWVRKTIDLSGYDLSSIAWHLGVDNGYTLFVNGHLVSSGNAEGYTSRWEYGGNFPQDLLRPGGNVVAVALEDHGGETAFDMQITGTAVDPIARRLGDSWLGRWSVDSVSTGFDTLADGWFEVSRPCEIYQIETETVGPENIEILSITETELAFRIRDLPGTQRALAIVEERRYSGTQRVRVDSALPSVEVNGVKIAEPAARTAAALERIEILDPESLEPIDEIATGETFALRLTYTEVPCGEVSEKVTVRAGDRVRLVVAVTGKAKVFVSEPITVMTDDSRTGESR